MKLHLSYLISFLSFAFLLCTFQIKPAEVKCQKIEQQNDLLAYLPEELIHTILQQASEETDNFRCYMEEIHTISLVNKWWNQKTYTYLNRYITDLHNKYVNPYSLDDETFCRIVLTYPGLQKTDNDFYTKVNAYFIEGIMIRALGSVGLKDSLINDSLPQIKELIEKNPFLANYTWWDSTLYNKTYDDYIISEQILQPFAYAKGRSSIITCLASIKDYSKLDWLLQQLCKKNYNFDQIPHMLLVGDFNILSKLTYPYFNILEYTLDKGHCICAENTICDWCNVLHTMINGGLKVRNKEFIDLAKCYGTSHPKIASALKDKAVLCNKDCIEQIFIQDDTAHPLPLLLTSPLITATSRFYDGSTPLHALFKILFKENIYYTTREERNYQQNLLTYLLNKRIDVNAQDGWGNTALHFVVLQQHQKFTKILLKKGANPYIKNKRKELPIDLILNEWVADFQEGKCIRHLPIILSFMSRSVEKFDYTFYWTKFLKAVSKKDSNLKGNYKFCFHDQSLICKTLTFFLEPTPYHTVQNISTLLYQPIKFGANSVEPCSILDSGRFLTHILRATVEMLYKLTNSNNN